MCGPSDGAGNCKTWAELGGALNGVELCHRLTSHAEFCYPQAARNAIQNPLMVQAGDPVYGNFSDFFVGMAVFPFSGKNAAEGGQKLG